MPKESSFLLVSLKDQEAKKLAQVISSDTSRKVLDYLATKKATETELAQSLGLPLSTVHYNLKQLEAAKLVKADEFHYSEKGREVLHYSLANKYVIIAPEAASSKILDKLKTILPVIIILGGVSLALQFLKGAPAESVATYQATPMLKQAAVQQSAGMVAESAQAMPVAAPSIAPSAPSLAPQTSTLVVHTAQSQLNIALWFFLGAIAAVVLYALVERIRKR